MHLKRIEIRGLGLYNSAQWDIHEGLTVIIGESGSGKSMLYNLLHYGMGLGNIDKSLLREGVLQGSVSLCFEIQAPQELAGILIEEDDVILMRSIDIKGRNKVTLNGHTISISQLKAMSETSLFLSKQHAHLDLSRSSYLLSMVDHLVSPATLRDCTEAWTDLEAFKKYYALHTKDVLSIDALEQLRKSLEPLEALYKEPDLLSYEELDITARALEQQCTELQIIDDFLKTLESSGIESMALKCYNSFQEDLRPTIDTLIDTLHTLKTSLGHPQDTLHTVLTTLSHYDQQLTQIHSLAKRFHTPPDNLIQIYHTLQDTMNKHHAAVVVASEYEKKHAILVNHYHECTQKLTAERTHAAHILSDKLNTHLSHIGILHTTLALVLSPSTATSSGADKLQLMMCNTHDNVALPIESRASGGEMSRLYLLINSLSPHGGCYLFDEVDTGISGKTAMMIGKYLHMLARSQSVVVISHTPQVAAFADHLWQLEKHMDTTIETTMIYLAKEQHALGLSRILEGGDTQHSALVHAQHLIDEAHIMCHDHAIKNGERDTLPP